MEGVEEWREWDGMRWDGVGLRCVQLGVGGGLKKNIKKKTKNIKINS